MRRNVHSLDIFTGGRLLCTHLLSGQGCPPSTILGTRNLEALGYQQRRPHPSASPGFDTILSVTDRETDGQTDGYAAHSI